MNEDIQILEAVERYIAGQMNPDERVYFEQLRKTNPEIDQAVVEHTFFLQQMNRFDETKKFKNILSDTHIHLAEKGLIKSPKLKGKAKVVYLFNRYKRVATIAASIGGIVALTISALVWSLSPSKQKSEIDYLSGQLKDVKSQTASLKNDIKDIKNDVKNHIGTQTNNTNIPTITYKTGGTGFLIDTKGYLVTAAHIIDGAQYIAVQRNNGTDLNAKLVFVNKEKDIAILKIDDENYKAPSSIPYSVRRSGGDLAEDIYTLGYPRHNIVYADGYIAAKTGYKDDTLSCQISITANPGNSGSPIFNRNGEVIGVLNSKQNTAEGTVFAIHSKYIYAVLNELQKEDSSFKSIKLPATSNLKNKDRMQQVKTISDFVYMVKVD